MKYKFKAKPLDISTGGKEIVVINEEDAKEMNLSPMDRVKVTRDGEEGEIVIVDLTEKYLDSGVLGSFASLTEQMDLEEGEELYLQTIDKPESLEYIKKKLDGGELDKAEVKEIMNDVMDDKLSDIEMSAYISGVYTNGMTEEETVDFTESVIDTGEKLDIKSNTVMDKHCIGGVPGNRTTMLIVPIIAAAGIKIPKTSSRSITSPAGTADAMEVLSPVSHPKEDIENIIDKTNGCIVWGGAINLAAADDKLIRVRHPLSLDPRGMLLGSILAKKKAARASHVLIDIPIGTGAKIEEREEAEHLAEDFMRIGTRLNMEIHCIITPGYDPVGSAVGPSLEAREVLRILKGEEVSEDLREKSLRMSGILLEIAGEAENGKGYYKAKEILESGKAEEKMREIIEAQGGDPGIEPEQIDLGSHREDIYAEETGRIHYLHTDGIAEMGKAAGAPNDKKAGIYLNVEKGDKIEKGDKLMTVYAECDRKLQSALEI